MSRVDEENVEEAIKEAVNSYYKKGMFLDGLFWATTIRLLVQKYNLPTEKFMFGDVKE